MVSKIEFVVLGDVKDLKDKLGQLKSSFADLSRNAGIAFAGLSGAIVSATNAAKRQEQIMNQTRAVIKSTGSAAGVTADEMFKLAQGLQNVTTFGDEAILNGQNLLLTFKEIGKDVFPRATEAMLDVSTSMNQGIKESAIQLGKALNDPILGITALRRVGIQFTDKQEDVIKALAKTGDIAKAQTLILDELESQFGGSARAAREGLGAFDALRESIGDLVEEIGIALAPTMGKLSTSLNKLVDDLKVNKDFAKNTAQVLLMGAALSGLLTVVGLVGQSIIGLTASINFLNASMIPLTSTLSISLAGALKGIALLGGSAFVGWKIGEVIGEATGLNEALSGPDGLFTKMFIALQDKVSPALEDFKQRFIDLKNLITGQAVSEFSGSLGGLFTQTGLNTPLEDDPNSLEAKQEKADEEVNIERNKFSLIDKIRAAFLGKELNDQESKEKQIAKLRNENLLGLKSFLGQSVTASKGAANAFKTISIGEAIINTSKGVTKALSNLDFITAAIVAAKGAIEIGTIASQSFAVGTPSVPYDMLANVHKGEMIIPQKFSDALRSGDLSLSGGNGGQPTIDLRGSTFNGINEDLVEDMFKKASEMINNNTLSFKAG